MKQEAGKHWESIQIGNMSRDELIKRRDESLKAYYERQDQKFKDAQTKKQ